MRPEAGECADREPELVPVAASVFDDEFFRSSGARGRAAAEGIAHAAAAAVPNPAGVARDLRAAAPAEHGEADELDIPAFLRRSH